MPLPYLSTRNEQAEREAKEAKERVLQRASILKQQVTERRNSLIELATTHLKNSKTPMEVVLKLMNSTSISCNDILEALRGSSCTDTDNQALYHETIDLLTKLISIRIPYSKPLRSEAMTNIDWFYEGVYLEQRLRSYDYEFQRLTPGLTREFKTLLQQNALHTEIESSGTSQVRSKLYKHNDPFITNIEDVLVESKYIMAEVLQDYLPIVTVNPRGDIDYISISIRHNITGEVDTHVDIQEANADLIATILGHDNSAYLYTSKWNEVSPTHILAHYLNITAPFERVKIADIYRNRAMSSYIYEHSYINLAYTSLEEFGATIEGLTNFINIENVHIISKVVVLLSHIYDILKVVIDSPEYQELKTTDTSISEHFMDAAYGNYESLRQQLGINSYKLLSSNNYRSAISIEPMYSDRSTFRDNTIASRDTGMRDMVYTKKPYEGGGSSRHYRETHDSIRWSKNEIATYKDLSNDTIDKIVLSLKVTSRIKEYLHYQAEIHNFITTDKLDKLINREKGTPKKDPINDLYDVVEQYVDNNTLRSFVNNMKLGRREGRWRR